VADGAAGRHFGKKRPSGRLDRRRTDRVGRRSIRRVRESTLRRRGALSPRPRKVTRLSHVGMTACHRGVASHRLALGGCVPTPDVVDELASDEVYRSVVGTGVDSVTLRFSEGPRGSSGCWRVLCRPHNPWSAHWAVDDVTGRQAPYAGCSRDRRGMEAMPPLSRMVTLRGADQEGGGRHGMVGGGNPAPESNWPTVSRLTRHWAPSRTASPSNGSSLRPSRIANRT
jgi:hypothetical protein